MTSCERGLMNDGRLADCFPCLKIRAIRFVFVSKAPYTTVKQNPAQNLYDLEINIKKRICMSMWKPFHLLNTYDYTVLRYFYVCSREHLSLTFAITMKRLNV